MTALRTSYVTRECLGMLGAWWNLVCHLFTAPAHGTRMVVVQKTGELFPEAFIALCTMTRHYCSFKQFFLDGLRQIGPEHHYGSAEGLLEVLFLVCESRHVFAVNGQWARRTFPA